MHKACLSAVNMLSDAFSQVISPGREVPKAHGLIGASSKPFLTIYGCQQLLLQPLLAHEQKTAEAQAVIGRDSLTSSRSCGQGHTIMPAHIWSCMVNLPQAAGHAQSGISLVSDAEYHTCWPGDSHCFNCLRPWMPGYTQRKDASASPSSESLPKTFLSSSACAV